MHRDPDLLFALLALDKGRITQDQFLDALELHAMDRSRSLRTLVLGFGALSKEDESALESQVRDRMDKTDTAATLAPGGGGASVSDDIRGLLEGLDDGPSPDEAGHVSLDLSDDEAALLAPDTGPDRYDFRQELGRGALGEVLLARDRKFGREVAVKLMRKTDAALPDRMRFLREGQVAGRLTHPNVVPVFDLGSMNRGRGQEPYFTMARISGRDLEDVLRALARGEEEALAAYTRARLLAIFLDVCHAMAYAHDNGVIHRDLKPANVMIGDYGETYVVDWGLAKVLGEPDAPVDETAGNGGDAAPADGDEPQLTLEGQIMGTPAFMSPEQAAGKISEVDRQSDIYSLGAILYQILTYRPPFEGTTVLEVLSKVLHEDVPRPTVHTVTRLEADLETGEVTRDSFDETIPPELEDTCLRALAKRKEDRFRSAGELASEIQQYLEGEKTRERLHQLALAKVEEGRDAVETLASLRRELEEQSKEVQEAEEGVKPFWPLEKKQAFWTLQERVARLRDDVVRTFGRSAAAFQEALGFERENTDARAGLADLYWDQYLREEEAQDEGQMQYFMDLVRQYNDGQYDARLKGDGTLAVATRAYTCDCLRRGRPVPPGEMDACGYHPVSGRALEGGPGAAGLADLEPDGPVERKVHGPDCEPLPAEGADLWLFRYEEVDHCLAPRFPEGAACAHGARQALPDRVADALFGAPSPVRPSEGLYLGISPVEGIILPMGSYLVVAALEGFHPLRVPVDVGRLADERVTATLYREGEVPDGFVPIPGGPFASGGDVKNPYSGPRERLVLDDFLLARFPVTCRDYLAFLDDLARTDPAQVAARIPRESEKAGSYWPQLGDGSVAIPTQAWLADAPPSQKEQARRLAQSPLDWSEDWPVFGVSWEDAVAYADWFSRTRGVVACLPHEQMWEKGARGPDGRIYPWGDYLEETYFNGLRSHGGAPRPCPVDSFPADASPYGVRGIAGNATDWCLNEVDDGKRRILRGGSWVVYGLSTRSPGRMAGAQGRIGQGNGFRLALLPRAKLDKAVTAD